MHRHDQEWTHAVCGSTRTVPGSGHFRVPHNPTPRLYLPKIYFDQNCTVRKVGVFDLCFSTTTVHNPKLSQFFQTNKKLQKSVTIWEHLPKRYYFWTIIKQKQKGKQCDNLGCEICCPTAKTIRKFCW